MKTRLKVLTGLLLLIFLTTSLTLAALAETSSEDEALFRNEEVGLAPDEVGLLATFSVTSTTDASDANPGDGTCASAAAECTLRAAIEEANASFVVPDTIMLQAGTYTLTLGQLHITSPMTITGISASSTIIDGNKANRIFRLNADGQATISDVTITNGHDQKGGGIHVFLGVLNLRNSTVFSNSTENNDGGGILNEAGMLTIENSTISNNMGFGGGGVSNRDGTATISNTIISGNTALAGGLVNPGIGVGGGVSNVAVTDNATLTINQSTITTNTATGTGGGGVNNNASNNHTATTTLNYTLVSGNDAIPTTTLINSATGFGGGIRNGFAEPVSETTTSIMEVNNSVVSNNNAVNAGGIGSGTTSTTSTLTLKATVNNSTISGNSTVANNIINELVGNGGGLVNVNGIMSLINGTVSGNAANGTNPTFGGYGGGIFNGDLSRATTLWLTNTTVSSNTVVNDGEGVANFKAGSTTPNANFKNSIIGGGCFNFNGTFSSQGHNIDTNNICNLTATGDVSGVNPLLNSLQSNGGPTIGATGATAPMLTHSPVKGSSAIDGGDNTICNASPINSVDQRGQPRPGSGSSTCDIGAFELQGANLGLTKTASHTLVDSVTTITYTITVNNPLAGAASSVVVSDTLPVSVTMVSSSTTNSSAYDPATGVWNVGSVTGGGNVVLTLVVSGTLNEDETITNTATITTSDPIDLISGNNTDSASITVGSTGSTGVFIPIIIKN